jgi:chromosome segregation protein
VTRILRLEIKGFKSFARQTVLEFGKDYNVVIGPNGSGKSNIIDAICFVLGKTSAKGLRAEKSANLIYNGGKSKQPAKEGTVALIFSNDEKEFPLETAEISISRTIHENGNSTYRINGKKYSRQEMLDLLSFAKVNPDAYNIILQGDIIRFIEMSGEERRKTIEQISDISIYEDKKQKALLELTKVEESIKEAGIILKEREVYLKELSKEKEQALKYQESEKLVKSGRATLLSLQLQTKQSESAKITEKNSEVLQQQEKIIKTISEIKQKIEEKKARIAQINTHIDEQGSAESKRINREIETLRITIATKKSSQQSTQEELGRLTNRQKQLEQNKQEYEQKIVIAQKEVDELISQEKQQTTLLKEFEQKLLALKKKHNLEHASQIESQIDALDKTIDEEQKLIDTLRTDQQEALRSKDRLELQIRTADEKIQKVAQLTQEHAGELQSITQKKQEVKKVTLDISQALTTDSSLASQLSNAKSRLTYVQEELAKLSARRASIQETLGGSIAIAKIIENRQKIGGVHGTISSLGSVDQKYAKALEVSAGTKIKAIVVEDDECAARCIEFLKKNQLGVATFLPLNKIKSHTKEVVPKGNGIHGLAIDIITFDKKYHNAFSHVFQNTVVVEDIAVARKVGVGTYRMATLDGDLTETSGSMQGGFRQKSAQSGLSFSQKEVTEKTLQLETEASDLQSVIERVQLKKTTSEDEVIRLREAKSTLEGEIIKLEKSLHLDDADIDMTKKLADSFKKDLQEHDKKYTELSSTITSKNTQLAKIKTQRAQLKNSLTDMKSPTVIAEFATIEEKIKHIQTALVRIDSTKQSTANNIKNVLAIEVENNAKILKVHDKERSEFQEKITALIQAITEESTRLEQLEKEQKAHSAQFSKLLDERTKLLEQIESDQETIISKEEAVRELEKKISGVSLELAKLKAEYDMIFAEFEPLKDIPLLDVTIDEVKKIISSNEGILTRLGAVNMKALELFERVYAEFEKLVSKRDVLVAEKEQIHVMINEIETRKKELFMLVFNRLNENFQRIFRTLVTKGEAYIELENPDQPFEGGANIKVKLSGTKFMDIRSLSGGEKTMTAMAFIFAIQENDPASFYVLDEVDAALDKHNSEKLAKLVEVYSKKAQYVVISHNDGMIGAAHTVYGVSMDADGISKVVSLKLS